MKFGTLMHIGPLNPGTRKKSRFRNPRWQKTIVLEMEIVVYPFKFPENVK